jgi:hypothetical protein
MRKASLLAAVAVSLGALSLAAAASAQSFAIHNLGTEDHTNGFTGTIPSTAPGFGNTITVMSDGEVAIMPFGITHDVSDAVQLASIWVGGAGWENVGGGVWDIPACSGGGCENANILEPIGMWTAPGFTWVNGMNEYIIWEDPNDGGGWSDEIRTFNLPDGTAAFTFASGVPEASTWAMMVLGLGLVGFTLRRRQGAALAA